MVIIFRVQREFGEVAGYPNKLQHAVRKGRLSGLDIPDSIHDWLRRLDELVEQLPVPLSM